MIRIDDMGTDDMGTDDMGTDDMATVTRLLSAYQSAVEAFASAAEVCA